MVFANKLLKPDIHFFTVTQVVGGQIKCFKLSKFASVVPFTINTEITVPLHSKAISNIPCNPLIEGNKWLTTIAIH